MTSYSLVRGRAMRATKTNGCGNPLLGPDSVVASKGFVSVAMTANTETGTAIQVTNANGDLCVNDTPVPKFTNYTVVITFCGVNPELVHMLTGQPLVLAGDGTTPVGFRQNSRVDVDLIGFALELWSVVLSDECSTTGDASYGYFLLPFLKGGVLGDLSVENGAVNFTVNGAVTREGSGWGVGPFDVTRDSGGVESPLANAITAGDHLHMEVVTVPPPDTTSDSSQALGTPATLITAGIPATLTPTNSYPPANFAALSLTTGLASPTTAWTTGQYVLLRDDTKAHWNGTAWVVGPA